MNKFTENQLVIHGEPTGRHRAPGIPTDYYFHRWAFPDVNNTDWLLLLSPFFLRNLQANLDGEPIHVAQEKQGSYLLVTQQYVSNRYNHLRSVVWPCPFCTYIQDGLAKIVERHGPRTDLFSNAPFIEAIRHMAQHFEELGSEEYGHLKFAWLKENGYRYYGDHYEYSDNLDQC